MFDGRADSTDRRSLHTAFIAIGSVLILSAVSVYAFYDLNGKSFDIADRELRLIVTDSMEGELMQYDIQTIQKNSLVMVSFLSDGEKEGLKEGDVIQFSYNGMLNHHRVVSNDIDGRRVVTKGDNSPSYETVDYSDIKGIVIGENHILGEAIRFAKDYFLVIIASVVMLYTGFCLVREIRNAKQGDNSDEE